MPAEVAELQLSERPDRLIMYVPGLSPARARSCANLAAALARKTMPKCSGNAANRLQPLYGKSYFGVYFADNYTWFQENGIRPFTMRSLQGKVIPMWINDPGGLERAKNPKARIRTTVDGRTQVLIFRKATNPGAPGRISVRGGGGRIGQGNVGVKWRHPGIQPKFFLNRAISLAAQQHGILPVRIYIADGTWRRFIRDYEEKVL